MLIALATGLAAVLLLLTVPVDVTVSVQRYHAFRGRVIVAWLFGLVRYSPKTDRTTPPVRKIRRAKKPVPDAPPEKRLRYRVTQSQDIQRALTVLRTRGFLKRVARLVGDLITRIRIRVFTIRGRIGLGDPAGTGQFWGLIHALTAVLTQRVILAVEPDFERAIFEIDGRGVFRIIPLQILLLMTLFLLSPSTLRAVWTGTQVAMEARRQRKRRQRDRGRMR